MYICRARVTNCSSFSIGKVIANFSRHDKFESRPKRLWFLSSIVCFFKRFVGHFLSGNQYLQNPECFGPQKDKCFLSFLHYIIVKFSFRDLFSPENLSVFFFFFSCQRCMRWIRVVMSLSYQLTFQTLSECSTFYSVVRSLNLAEKINVTFFPFQIFFYFVSWEPEGRWRFRKMFRWEPEGCYCCTKSMVIAPFWLSTEHR